jgi:hypothetical protein
MKTIKKFILSVIGVIQDARELQAEEMKKRYFQR